MEKTDKIIKPLYGAQIQPPKKNVPKHILRIQTENKTFFKSVSSEMISLGKYADIGNAETSQIHSKNF